MNRTSNYFKNIKFNSIVNKTLANNYKKMIIFNNKNNTKKYYQYSNIRKFTSKTIPLSFNNGKYEPPLPPYNYYYILAAIIGYGIAFKSIKKQKK